MSPKLAVFAIVLGGALTARATAAQVVRYGAVTSEARTILENMWSDEPHQNERAYCASNWSASAMAERSSAPTREDSVYNVTVVQRSPVRASGPNSVDFECPSGVPEIHTHTPTTCVGDDLASCIVGGINAYSCQPSRQDLEKLVRRGDPFAVVQCDLRAFRFYYPQEYVAGSAPVGADAAGGARNASYQQGRSRGARNRPR